MKYMAECPEGVVIRRSKRTYTHAVLWVRDGVVTNANWCGSYALAQKQARRAHAPAHAPSWTPKIVAVERFGRIDFKEGMIIHE